MKPQTVSFSGGCSRIELEFVREDDPQLQSFGDCSVRMSVESDGIDVTDWTCWVGADKLKRFARDLNALNATMKGSAELCSMSPGELAFIVRQYSARGAYEVEGQVGRHNFGRSTRRMSIIAFSFDVELTQIERASRQVSLLTANGLGDRP